MFTMLKSRIVRIEELGKVQCKQKFFCFFFRIEYLEKSKNLQEQLKELKNEIEVLKVEEKQTPMDKIHEENLLLGENKYSTLRRVSPFRTFGWI